MRYLIPVVVGSVLAACAAPPSSAQVAVNVYASVTASSISLTNTTGARITVLRPGLYRFVVTDRSSRRDFHLAGPRGTLRRTTLPFVGKVGWTLKLMKGRYRFYSDGDPALHGRFKVT